ncbi:hypothetical protein OK349_13195 [Sphingomonas sp. BT-65]|uniref:hypothetical protein n=1 Tax=Sphingomonas sp. BT-65 TaxID=2989821 RepID=UPI002235DAA2|nr:hypothetical protein [Sphingomonas sp. BT-65]MCW4462667.1 hypothetical protein [Sphingomonas sp. BT-65]
MLMMFLGLQAATGEPVRMLQPVESAVIQRAVVSKLRDPDSAKFDLPPVIVSSDRYCGRVNSKNGFGGYVGYKRFVVLLVRDRQGKITSATDPAVQSSDPLLSMIVERACAKGGY